MKPVDQTRFGEDNGNCLQAAIASVLELTLEQVPDFANEHEDEWHEKLNEWLERWYGMWLALVDLKATPAGYHLICGNAAHGTLEGEHVVVGLDGVMVHDPSPFPDSQGLVDEKAYGLFVTKLDSRRARKPVEPMPSRGIL